MSSVEGTNGAPNTAVDPETAETAVRAVAAVVPKTKPFDIPKELAAKIAEAKSKVEAVAKNGRNNDQNYNYVKSEDVVDTARQALNEAKVVVLPPTLIREEFSDLSSRGGASGMFVKAWFDFRVVDGETGEGYSTEKLGTATDYPGDKAIFKAETGATKYFLSALLSIPMGDGSDPETTDHGGGGAKVDRKSTKPASDKQKALFKDLMGKANLPSPANKAIVAFVGGNEPKKGMISDAIDALMDGRGLEFAKEHGWDGTVEETPADDAAPADQSGEQTPQGDTPPADTAADTIDTKDAEALLKLCREKECKQGEVKVFLTTVGVTLPEGDDLTKDALHAAIGQMTQEQAGKFETLVVNAAQAKEASATAADPAPATDAPAEAPATPEIDPNSVHGALIKTAERLGFAHELENVSKLIFDSEVKDLSEGAFDELSSLLERAHGCGISASSLGACVRQGLEGTDEVAVRNEKFVGWIKGTEDKVAATAQADAAAEAAEGSQE